MNRPLCPVCRIRFLPADGCCPRCGPSARDAAPVPEPEQPASVIMVRAPILCQHCLVRPVGDGRVGLCYVCHNKPDIRRLYPAMTDEDRNHLAKRAKDRYREQTIEELEAMIESRRATMPGEVGEPEPAERDIRRVPNRRGKRK